MTVSLTNLSGPIYMPNGSTPVEGKVSFELTSWDQEVGEAMIISGPIYANIDSNGNINVSLFTTTEGSRSVVYKMYVHWLDDTHNNEFVNNAYITTQSPSYTKQYIGSFALSGPGPYLIGNLNIVSELGASSFDVYAECLAFLTQVTLIKNDVEDLVSAFSVSTRISYAFDTLSQLNNTTVPSNINYVSINDKRYVRNLGGNTEFASQGGIPWSPIFRVEYNLPILVLATGQSNMLGHAGLTSGDRRTINGNVYLWEQFPGGGQTTGWKRAGPDSTDWPYLTTGNNLAYHFCDMLERTTGRTVLLVMQAQGGTPLAEWLPNGGLIAGATGEMYTALNSSLVAAREAPVPGRPDGATLTALGMTQADIMLWHQGEADANYRSATDTRALSGAQYLARFRSMVDTLRNPASGGSGAASFLRASAPVIAGELLIGGTSGGNSTDDRNNELRKMRDEDQFMTCVPSDGLGTQDNLHFDGRDLVEFARRYFLALGVFPKTHWIEKGTSGTTDWIKYSDGRLTMERNDVASVSTSIATGSGFTSGSQVWTFPSGSGIPSFIEAPMVTPQNSGATNRWISVSVRSTSSVTFVAHSWTNITPSISIGGRAEGFWR